MLFCMDFYRRSLIPGPAPDARETVQVNVAGARFKVRAMRSIKPTDRVPLVFMSHAGRNYFQFRINDQVASLEYALEGKETIALKQLDVSHCTDPISYGRALIERVLDHAHRSGFLIIPQSRAVQGFIQEKCEYRKLIAPVFGMTFTAALTDTINGVTN